MTDKLNDKALLPCPFCNGKASFKPASFKASCDRCGAHVPVGAKSSDEAIAAWNRRAAAALPDADGLEVAKVARQLEGRASGDTLRTYSDRMASDDQKAASIIRPQAETIERLKAELEDWKGKHTNGVRAYADVLARAKAAEDRLSRATEHLSRALDHYDRGVCLHESVHRGGSIWTICDECGRKWADDKGGFQPHVDPPEIRAAREFLEGGE